MLYGHYAKGEIMVTEKTWDEFRSAGFFVFINGFLHVFGWAIVMEIDNKKVSRVYPARVKFRGFDEKSTEKAYLKITEYMNNNSDILLDETRNKGS